MRTRVVVASIIEKEGRFLFGRKDKDVSPYPNKWLILGGCMREGESILEALKREIMEEAGIEIDDIEPLRFDEDIGVRNGEEVHFVFLQFKSRWKSGEPRPGDDIVELRWADRKEIPGLEFSKPTLKLFKKIGFLD